MIWKTLKQKDIGGLCNVTYISLEQPNRIVEIELYKEENEFILQFAKDDHYVGKPKIFNSLTQAKSTAENWFRKEVDKHLKQINKTLGEELCQIK